MPLLKAAPFDIRGTSKTKVLGSKENIKCVNHPNYFSSSMIFNKLLDPTLVGLLIPGEGVEHTLKREQRSVLLDRHSEAQCCHRREGEVLLYLTKTIDILPQKESPGLQLPWCNLCVQFGGEIPVLVEEALTFWSVFSRPRKGGLGVFETNAMSPRYVVKKSYGQKVFQSRPIYLSCYILVKDNSVVDQWNT